jgi:nucleoside-diphosphate-sugar epimerase
MMKILVTGKSGFIGKRVKGKSFKGNILSYRDLLRSTTGIEGIVHLAAKSNLRRCEENPKECIDTNLTGFANVLDVALKRDLWVIFISTFQVTELNLYGLTKLAGEELCRVYQKKGLRVKILRLPIVYGPSDKSDKIVTKFISEIRQGFEPSIDTEKKFHFAYVDDVANIIESEVNILQCNLGKKYSLTDLANGIRKCLNEKEK